MTDLGHISQEDLALLAMRSLPGQEAAELRRHLATCAQCRAQLAEISGDLALLALSVDQHPLPSGAHERFQSRLAATPQSARPDATAPPIALSGRTYAEAVPTESAASRPRRGVGFWAPWAAAVAMGITAFALGVQNSNLNDELSQESSLVSQLAAKASRAQQVLEVLTAPSAQRVTLSTGKTPAEPTGRAVYLPERGALIFQANNLRPIPEGKTYELWVIPASGKPPLPAGLFRPDAAGAATLVMPQIPAGVPAKGFGVTIEAAQGSDTPTAPIVLSGQ